MGFTHFSVKSFTLPNGQRCEIEHDSLRLGPGKMAVSDAVQFVRILLTEIPLVVDDTRLKLVHEIRESLVKEEPVTGKRWLVLDALRNVSLRKWHHRRAS